MVNLKNINWIIKRKREIGKRYTDLLKTNNRIYIQPERNEFAKNIYWVFGLVLKPQKVKIKRDNVIKKLYEKKIQTTPFLLSNA